MRREPTFRAGVWSSRYVGRHVSRAATTSTSQRPNPHLPSLGTRTGLLRTVLAWDLRPQEAAVSQRRMREASGTQDQQSWSPAYPTSRLGLPADIVLVGPRA